MMQSGFMFHGEIKQKHCGMMKVVVIEIEDHKLCLGS